MKPLRIGIIGCGRMGRERALACATLGHSVAILCDVDQRRAQELAATLPAARVVSAMDEAEWKILDAVFICTPPGLRADLLRLAVRAGLPFFLEKPIDVSADGSEEILRDLPRRPIVNAVGYMNRCRESVRHARAVLAGCRTLGIACHWAGKIYQVPWWLDSTLSGGPLNEQATHLVDLCRFLIGEVDSVTAVAAPVRQGGPELTFAVALSFAGGQVGTILYTCEAHEKDIGVHILAVEGSLELSGWDFRLTRNSIDATLPAEQAQSIFAAETEGFLRAVGEKKPGGTACNYADAICTQAVVDAIRHSMSSGRPARVAERMSRAV